jgi:PKD repeat protein
MSGGNVDYTTQNVNVTYPTSGNYTIRLSATNTYGLGLETIYLYLTS